MAVNTATSRTLGQSERELLGQRAGRSGAGQPIKGLEDLDKAVEQVWRSGKTVQLEAHFHPANAPGTQAWLFSLYPVKDSDDETCAVALAPADITEQSQARDAALVMAPVPLPSPLWKRNSASRYPSNCALCGC
ncbi:hypothetical protein AQI96_33775 [Streptomyces canus]|nr:hypothetical protein AQI96_33775 [Streptomyces canus]